MEHELIRARFEAFLKTKSLKLTSQREAIFERAFATHDHFTAETLHRWMCEGDDSRGKTVSRATVYRTLGLLEDAGFIGSLDTGRGELLYEHLLGHEHHDHLVCMECGKIEEFRNDMIEDLQEKVALDHGFVLMRHSLRLEGNCSDCAKKATEKESAGAQQPSPSELS